MTQTVARVLQLPIVFEYRPQHCAWTVANGEIIGWFHLSHSGEVGAVYVKPREIKLEDSLIVDVRRKYGFGLPVKIEKQVEWSGGPRGGDFPSQTTDLAIICRGHSVEVLVTDTWGHDPAPWEQAKVADAWQMRHEFFQLKQNTSELLGFLKKWGDWNGFNVLSSTIWKQRDFFRKALLGSPWFGVGPAGLQLNATTQYPHFVVREQDCFSAICTTITLDLLRKIRFGVCARQDCRAPFAIESRHKRKFCCQYCAHIESVRKQRRNAMKSRKER